MERPGFSRGDARSAISPHALLQVSLRLVVPNSCARSLRMPAARASFDVSLAPSTSWSFRLAVSCPISGNSIVPKGSWAPPGMKLFLPDRYGPNAPCSQAPNSPWLLESACATWRCAACRGQFSRTSLATGQGPVRPRSLSQRDENNRTLILRRTECISCSSKAARTPSVLRPGASVFGKSALLGIDPVLHIRHKQAVRDC